MGAWSHEIFGNDAACDWAADLKRTSQLGYIESAIRAAEESGYLRAHVASAALAACEVIARLLGNPGRDEDYVDEVEAWVLAHQLPIPEERRLRALAVVGRVLSTDSELRELWEMGDASEWVDVAEDLRRRLLL